MCPERETPRPSWAAVLSWKEALAHGRGMPVGAVAGKELCDVPSRLLAGSCSEDTQRPGGAVVLVLGNPGNVP